MRLREIKYVLDTIDIENSVLSFKKNNGTTDLTATNINNFKKFLNIAETLPFFQADVALLRQSELFSTTKDELYLSVEITSQIGETSSYIVNAAKALSRVLLSILPEQKENSIHIKFPCSNDFKSIIAFQADFEKAINQVINNDKINGKLNINNWESGSFWVELILLSQAAVSLVARIAWSASVISKKIKESEMLTQQVRSLEIKNESLDDILEKQKLATNLLIEQEVRHLQMEHFDSDEDNELFERLKMATKTFAELIQQGAEVHPSLTAPEQAKNLFPNYKFIESIISQIKLLEDTPSIESEE